MRIFRRRLIRAPAEREREREAKSALEHERAKETLARTADAWKRLELLEIEAELLARRKAV